MFSKQASRRLFLRQAGALSTLGATAAPLALNLAAMGSVAAQTASSYKALICIYLHGGNDPFNTVLATDTSSWTNYAALRKQAPESIALMPVGTAPKSSALAGSPTRLGGVLPIAPLNAQSRSYALHPLLRELQTMFNTERRLAIVANTGTLVMPTTKAQYATATHPRPQKLFSHNDQASIWQAFAPEGSARGWGGRMCDVLAGGADVSSFAAVSAAGQAVWLTGEKTAGYMITPGGALRVGVEPTGSMFGSHVVGDTLTRIAGGSRTGHVLEQDYVAVVQRSMRTESEISPLLKPGSDSRWGSAMSGTYNGANDAKLRYVDPISHASTLNPLSQQLQVVARMIDAGQTLGLKRQVFFVSMGGFDTHNTQNSTHSDLMARLAQAMRYLDTTLGAMGMRDKVTAFTASDFGRSFTSNGDGTDHGWGSHHFVMGAAVKGGDVYGNFPILGAKNKSNNQFDSSPNQLLNGVLLPEISVDQYGATLGRWFGLSDVQLLDVFPNLDQFNATKRNLGFMV